jgi:hypothetical protein
VSGCTLGVGVGSDVVACARPADPEPTPIRELVRFHDAVLRAPAPASFRAAIALMLERLGYVVITEAGAYELIVTRKRRANSCWRSSSAASAKLGGAGGM